MAKQKIVAKKFSFKLNVFAGEAVLFLLTQLLGLAVVLKTQQTWSDITQQLPEISWLNFLIYFALGTILILVLLRLTSKKSGVLFNIIFALAIFSGSQVIFSLIMPDLWAICCAILLVVLRFLRPSIIIQNITMILAIAGLGATIGLSLSLFSAIVILMALSIYDFIAVYKTGHMVKMAKQMMASRSLLAFVVPQTLVGYKNNLSKIKVGQGQVFILGSGDVVMPLIAIAAVSRLSMWHSIIVLLFSLLGLILMQVIFSTQRVRRPMAALPPIALLTIIGIFVSVLMLGA